MFIEIDQVSQLQIFMLTIISLVLILTNSCDTSYSFDSSSCVFYMNYVDEGCSAFNFSKCLWQQCNAWVSIRGVMHCINYETKTNSDWNACTRICCDSGSQLPLTSDGINQCQKSITKRLIILGIVIGGIVGATIVIIVIVIIWKKCKQRFSIVHPVQENHQQMNISLQGLKQWKEVDVSKPFLKNITCSVCLQEGCFFELECLHVYHLKCILLCLKNKKECILCRRKELQKVCVYCHKCFKFFYQSLLKNFTDLVNSEQICQRCKNQGSDL